MRNPFTVLKSALVSLAGIGKPVERKPAPSIHVPREKREREFSEIERENPAPAPLDVRSYIPTQRARNQRRRERASVRAFVRRLNQGRG